MFLASGMLMNDLNRKKKLVEVKKNQLEKIINMLKIILRNKYAKFYVISFEKITSGKDLIFHYMKFKTFIGIPKR